MHSGKWERVKGEGIHYYSKKFWISACSFKIAQIDFLNSIYEIKKQRNKLVVFQIIEDCIKFNTYAVKEQAKMKNVCWN